MSMSLRSLTLALSAVLTACAVGPNYHRPAAPKATDYGSAPSQGTTAGTEGVAGAAQHFVGGEDIPGQWWTLFQSPKLTALIEQSLDARAGLGFGDPGLGGDVLVRARRDREAALHQVEQALIEVVERDRRAVLARAQLRLEIRVGYFSHCAASFAW